MLWYYLTVAFPCSMLLQTLILRAFLGVREGLLIRSLGNSLMEVSGSLAKFFSFWEREKGGGGVEKYLPFYPSLFTLKLDILFTAETSSVLEN